MIFTQLRTLRWPDLPTLPGLLCVSSSVYFSFKDLFAVAYVLILAQFILDYADGKMARTIGGGLRGSTWTGVSDFMAVRLAYFTATTQKGFTGVPTVLAAVAVSTIAYLGYFFAKASIGWFVVFYFASAVAMISDLRVQKISLYLRGWTK